MILSSDIKHQVELALLEDCGDGDLSAALLDQSSHGVARLMNREAMVLCGQAWVDETFRQLNAQVSVQWFFDESEWVDANQVLCEIKGPSWSLLTGERTALNFLQLLSATATTTHAYVKAIGENAVKLLDTRKTIPGLRLAQKYAVCCGGGHNHRMGLYDAILIKENHIKAVGSISAAVNKARLLSPDVMLEVEVETLEELDEALALQVDRIMLDNFSEAMLQEALTRQRSKTEYELSGNISLDSIGKWSAMGVDCISVGALTKHVQAIDLSMRFIDLS